MNQLTEGAAPGIDLPDLPARGRLTIAEALSLPAATDVETAGRALGFSRNASYKQVREGTFPAKVIKVGRCYRVVTADLLRVLEIQPRDNNGAEAATSTPSVEHVNESTKQQIGTHS